MRQWLEFCVLFRQFALFGIKVFSTLNHADEEKEKKTSNRVNYSEFHVCEWEEEEEESWNCAGIEFDVSVPECA